MIDFYTYIRILALRKDCITENKFGKENILLGKIYEENIK